MIHHWQPPNEFHITSGRLFRQSLKQFPSFPQQNTSRSPFPSKYPLQSPFSSKKKCFPSNSQLFLVGCRLTGIKWQRRVKLPFSCQSGAPFVLPVSRPGIHPSNTKSSISNSLSVLPNIFQDSEGYRRADTVVQGPHPKIFLTAHTD